MHGADIRMSFRGTTRSGSFPKDLFHEAEIYTALVTNHQSVGPTDKAAVGELGGALLIIAAVVHVAEWGQSLRDIPADRGHFVSSFRWFLSGFLLFWFGSQMDDREQASYGQEKRLRGKQAEVIAALAPLCGVPWRACLKSDSEMDR